MRPVGGFRNETLGKPRPLLQRTQITLLPELVIEDDANGIGAQLLNGIRHKVLGSIATAQETAGRAENSNIRGDVTVGKFSVKILYA